MSTLDAARRHIRRRNGQFSFWLGRVVLLVVLLGAILGMSELHLLSNQSPDDVGSILFDEN